MRQSKMTACMHPCSAHPHSHTLQALLAAPLVGLYFGGAAAVRLLEQRRTGAQA